MVPCSSMACACLHVGPRYFPVYWSCPLALPLGCLVFVGFPSGFGLAGFGLCPLGFLFAVLVDFSLGCLHLRCGLGALAFRRHGSFVPVGPSLSVFMACFRCGWLRLLLLLLWLPLRSALFIWGQFRSKFTHTHTHQWAKSEVFCNTAIESAHADKEVATIKQVNSKDQQALRADDPQRACFFLSLVDFGLLIITQRCFFLCV